MSDGEGLVVKGSGLRLALKGELVWACRWR